MTEETGEPKNTARITFRGRTWEVKAGTTVRAAIIKCNLNPETVLPVIGGRLVTDDTQIRPGEEVKLVGVVSGG